MTGSRGGPLRIGVVGLGVMGMRHAAALASLDGVAYVGAADHSAPREALGRPVVGSLDALLSLGIDAAVVATPTPDHVHTATALAEAGVAALVEKPLAMDAEECAEIEAAFARVGLPAAVGHVERFHTAVRDLQLGLAAGRVGRITHVTTRRYGGRPRRRDGGVVLDLGSHDFDLTRWLTGLRHVEVRACATGGAPDTVVVTAALSGGAEAAHSLGWDSPHRIRTIEVRGEGGALVADTADPGTRPPVPEQLRAFRDLVRGRLGPGGVPACATLADGRYAVTVAAQAASSLRSRR